MGTQTSFAAVWGRGTVDRGRIEIRDGRLVLHALDGDSSASLAELVDVRRAFNGERLNRLPTLLLRFADGSELPVAPLGSSVALVADALVA